jgi:hypothetical protein
MERIMPRPSGNTPGRNPYEPTGPELLGAATILVGIKPPTRERAQAELSRLDEWLEANYGPSFSTWAEYWQYRESSESIAQ